MGPLHAGVHRGRGEGGSDSGRGPPRLTGVCSAGAPGPQGRETLASSGGAGRAPLSLPDPALGKEGTREANFFAWRVG